MNELERWANFYLTMSAAAATLLGLMFVVITLAAERRRGDAAKIPIYGYPQLMGHRHRCRPHPSWAGKFKVAHYRNPFPLDNLSIRELNIQ